MRRAFEFHLDLTLAQILAAMRAYLRFAFVTLAAVEACVPDRRARLSALLEPGPFADHKIKGQEEDQEKENEDRPKEPPPKGKSMFLGIEKDPEGDDQGDGRNQEDHGNSGEKTFRIVWKSEMK